jgi:hypothetical protein
MSNKVIAFTHIDKDCFDLTEEEKSFISNMNLYFYDGDHKEEDQIKAITYYVDCLSDIFIFIVDDWNHPPVKKGTRSAISDTKLIVHKEWEFSSSFNGDANSWWNGFYIAVCEKNKNE